MKVAIFHPAARAAIRSFPEDVRRELGKAIYDLQKGEVLAMPLSRPMPSIEPRAAELRIRGRPGFIARFITAVRCAAYWSFTRSSKRPRRHRYASWIWERSG